MAEPLSQTERQRIIDELVLGPVDARAVAHLLIDSLGLHCLNDEALAVAADVAAAMQRGRENNHD